MDKKQYEMNVLWEKFGNKNVSNSNGTEALNKKYWNHNKQ